jgi:single-stranded DNA-binding protein
MQSYERHRGGIFRRAWPRRGTQSLRRRQPYLRANIRVGDGEAAQWVGVLAFDEQAIAAADKFVKGARVYVEGRLTLDKWKGQDGAERVGFSCMSWHCRLSQIGRNKPQRDRAPADGRTKFTTAKPAASSARSDAEFSDDIPF